MIVLDPREISFPDPSQMDSESGIMAIGGDLSPERLLFAYEIGIFPWFNPGEEILWWCPDPRFVLYPENLKVSKSMRKILRDNTFTFSQNKCFRTVLENCANISRKDQQGTWLSEKLIDSFEQLHMRGVAKSYEVWQGEELVGGFYGIQIGKVFCGESMFATVSNASKAGFIHFVQTQGDFLDIIDCQIHSEHLESLGAGMISKEKYLKLLNKNTHES